MRRVTGEKRDGRCGTEREMTGERRDERDGRKMTRERRGGGEWGITGEKRGR